MTLEETGKILAVIKKEYPHAFKDFTPQEKKDKVVFWQEMFADDDYGVVGAAIKTYIATNTTPFAPTIGQIKANIRKLTRPDDMSEQEAVNLVLKATRRSLYHSQEEFDKLPPILQRLVGSPSKLKEWASMDAQTVNSVVASNLMRSYKVISEKEKEFQALPSNIQNYIAEMSNQFRLEGNSKLLSQGGNEGDIQNG